MSTLPKQSLFETMFNRRMLICIFIGFSSGLPLYVLFQQIPAWLRVEGIDLKIIGLFALMQFPYTWKFVWAPLMDRYVPPFLGRRRGWMLITQVALALLIAALALVDPSEGLALMLAIVAGIAFFSASQDIVIDAFRREILADEELGVGTSYAVNAYKFSSLIPGSLALVLADRMPWPTVNLIVAGFMLVGIITTLLVDEPVAVKTTPQTLSDAIVKPFKDFFSRPGGIQTSVAILLFMMLYKLGDNLATALETPFFVDMGYTLTEIGVVAKVCKLWAGVIGAIVGGVLMIRLGMNRSLWVFGFVQIMSILGYAMLASLEGQQELVWFGYNIDRLVPLAVAVSLEYFGVGLGQVALIAFMAYLCNTQFTATQFALLSSIASVPRVFISSGTGIMIEHLGYFSFFLVCFACAIPGMLMLFIVAPWNGVVAGTQEQQPKDAVSPD